MIMDQKAWDEFVKQHAPRSGAFLQSWQWGEFQQSLGREVRRVEGVGQFIRMNLPFGFFYWYCPRGPLVGSIPLLSKEGQGEVLQHATFIRFEPASKPAAPARRVADVQPSHTLLTSLSQSEDALLAAMHPKTRYNIRVAQKKDVAIELSSDAFDEAWSLFEQTGTRGQFRLHSRAYYENMLKHVATLSVARWQSKVVAANIFVDFAGMRTYLHGASSNASREVMAPYLLHWEMMKDAKQKGLTAYDWWGVAPMDAIGVHPWAGITRFKLGFGGERLEYPGTFDLVLRQGWYWAYTLARNFLRP